MLEAVKSACKKIIRSALASRGWELRRSVATNGPILPMLSILFETVTSTYGVGAVLQIGANDGLMEDPVHKIIVKLELPAVLVEPLPDTFERLKQNYAGRKSIFFENCAVSDKPGLAKIHRISSTTPGVPAWAHGLASFNRNVLLKHKHWDAFAHLPGGLDKYIETLEVPVCTVAQLLERNAQISKFTAMQIDTEGHDLSILKSAADANFFPPIINFEHKHLSMADQATGRELLAAQGYAFLSDSTDTLAYRA